MITSYISLDLQISGQSFTNIQEIRSRMFDWLFGNKNDDKKKKKAENSTEAQNKWKYQFLVQFLSGELWKSTILDFIDVKCVVFDSEEENKFQYTVIHNEFKSLVASLFDNMMEEVGIDNQTLVQLLEKGFQSKSRKVFEQLLYCDDFLKFKELMVQRNRTLENEAIQALRGSASFIKEPEDQEKFAIRESLRAQEARQKRLEEEQQQMLRKALQISKLQANQSKAIEELEQKASKIQQSSKTEPQKTEQESHNLNDEEQQRIKQEEQEKRKKDEERKKQLRARLNKKKNLAPISEPKEQTKPLSDLPPLKHPKKQEEPPEIKQEKQEKVEKIPQKNVEEESKIEAQEDRKKRLLEQREKIRKKKEEERRKMMESEESHKVTNIVLQQAGVNDGKGQQPKVAEQKVSQDEINRRRELMKRIKNRIVDDF